MPAETHDFITTTTTFKDGAQSWMIKASYPKDGVPRPALITMPGQGEAGANPSALDKYGPHYWLKNGWDGSVDLPNGKHYPVLITVVPSWTNPRGPQIHKLVEHLFKTFPIKRNSAHFAGLSMGAFTWSKYIAYEAKDGDETGMKNVTSLVLLQGASDETFAPYKEWSRGFGAFAVWAKEYNGKLFGLEGTQDTRAVWKASQPMNNAVPGSAFFSMETIDGGQHTGWNKMYDPKQKDFTLTNPLMANNKYYPSTPGTYQKGQSIFQWMLSQGDTSLVGVENGPKVFDKQDVINLVEDYLINIDNKVRFQSYVESKGYTLSQIGFPE